MLPLTYRQILPPNPSVNADLPVRAFYLAIAGGGRPVT
jgi:hypothetical protein